MVRVALIGCGPRGLAALEAMERRSASLTSVTVFDPRETLGTGHAYDLVQSGLNLFDAPLRDSDFGIGTFGVSFPDWVGVVEPDWHPPRALVGRYLAERCRFVAKRLPLQHVAHEAVQVVREPGRWTVRTRTRHHGPFDFVAVASGPGIRGRADWAQHARQGVGRYLLTSESRDMLAARRVMIHGLGWSMLDVVRDLTERRGGRFSQIHNPPDYIASGSEPSILAFSADGVLPVPRPLEPVEAGVLALSGPERAALLVPLSEGMGPEAFSHFRDAWAVVAGARGPGVASVREWLASGMLAPARDPLEQLREYVAEARGHSRPSSAYAAGQVWRLLLPHLRDLPPAPRPWLRDVEDRMGPFVAGCSVPAAERLLALGDAGLLKIAQADPGRVHLHPHGWRIEAAGEPFDADTMINADAVDRPEGFPHILEDLLDRGLARRTESGGLDTSPGGWLVDAEGQSQDGLAVLGARAPGGTRPGFSLRACFNGEAEVWAGRAFGDRASRRRRWRFW